MNSQFSLDLTSTSLESSASPGSITSSADNSGQYVRHHIDCAKQAIPRAYHLYSCRHCPFNALDMLRLRRHEQKHKSVKCTFPGCRKDFGHDRELRRHLHNVHEQGPVTETRCGREMRKDNILRHQRTCKKCKSMGD